MKKRPTTRRCTRGPSVFIGNGVISSDASATSTQAAASMRIAPALGRRLPESSLYSKSLSSLPEHYSDFAENERK
jgi:hypothetical protein